MSIMWKYLDKRSATIAAIKDYDAMQFILSSTGDEIKRTYEKMTGIGSPNYDGMPKACNPQAAEDRIIKNIDEIDIIKERYRQSAAYYVAEYLNIEQPTAYKRKNRALDRLTVLLFGKS